MRTDHWEGRVVFAIQLLDVLVQIEYDIVGSILDRVLSALSNVSGPCIFSCDAKPDFTTRFHHIYTL